MRLSSSSVQQYFRLIVNDFHWLAILCLAGISPLVSSRLVFSDGNSNDSDKLYLQSIKPILEKHCYACHGGLKQESGLRLDTAKFILAGGHSGEIVDQQTPANSELLKRISANDDSLMPPKHEGERLSPAQVELIASWIASGVQAIPDEAASMEPSQHWAFQPIQRPTLPTKVATSPSHNPIDQILSSNAFGESSQQREPPALVTLLRRLSIDLRGLPIEEEVLVSVLSNDSDSIYSELVEKWLADDAYGERWGRHWMDIWRYSDWWGLGEELRNSQLHMWHWRDWIIESLTANVPYDEMVRQMLAADELYPDDQQKLRATGFLARNFFLFNRNQWMEETVEHVGKGLLGLTMNCAKCHDHKYDPISQVDYYRMRAIFEPYHVRLDLIEGEADVRKNAVPRIFDREIDTATYLFVRGEESKPDESKPMAPGMPEFFAFAPYTPEPIQLPKASFQPETNRAAIKTYINKSETRLASLDKKRAAAQARIDELTKRFDALQSDLSDTDQIAQESHAPSMSFTEEWNGTDDLASLMDRWQLYSGEWSLSNGMLHQSARSSDRAIARWKGEVPRDLDAEITFQHTGGNQWKSVGISFDCTDENPLDGFQSSDNEVSVYASAYAGEQKIQISYVANGQWVYPGEGKVQQPIELNQLNTMRVIVRDQLINVMWNGKLVLAWNLPIPRQDGVLQLTTFDAQASFDRFRVEALDDETVMKRPTGELAFSNRSPAGINAQVQELRRELELLELESAVAHEELAFHELRLNDPDKAKFNSWASATASHKLAQAQRALDLAGEDSKDAKTQEWNQAKQFLEQVAKGDLSGFDPAYPGAKWSATRFQFSGKDDPDKEFPETSTGRRKALAQWITSPDNPLTARVAVNHIWVRHFGEHLVQDTFDFGMKAKRPEHLALLDWLAAEFIESRWDMKHLHRLIVQSEYYKSHHRSVPRLESQVVRDSLLSLAGKLDRTLGGPTIPASEQATSPRRSLYFFHSNNERNLFLSMFDEALVTECYRREESIVPQQALALSHSRMVLESVPAIAARIQKLAQGSHEQFVRLAFASIIGLEPTETELSLCLAMLSETDVPSDGTVANPTQESFSNKEELVWVLLNHHHFLQVP
ncbi:DUF1549 domain-containing protein [Pirellulaceae bacterium SH449]